MAGDAGTLLKAAASAGLVAAGHPGGVLGLTPGQLATAAQAGSHLSAAATRAVTGKRPGDLSPQEYDLVTDPARELTRRVAAAMRAAPGRPALVVLLDTGEVIGDRAWGWLRRVMTHTGPRVAWVVGARFEAEAEAGFDSPVVQFVRGIGNAHLVSMSPTRFDDAMIRAYLESRPNARYCTDAQIGMIAQFTRGLPLAVGFAGTLLEQRQPVEDVCREVDDGHASSVVSQLARRYLVHAEQEAYAADDPRRDDVAKILGLALAFGDLRSDRDLLAALWDTEAPLTAFWDLARRHDFVLPASRRLHNDVRDTLRTDLLDPWRRARARLINQRALALFDARLAEMRLKWPTLDEQLDHTGFTTALLAVLWHALWVDNQAGLDLFTWVLPVLAAADPPTIDAGLKGQQLVPAATAVTITGSLPHAARPAERAAPARPGTAMVTWVPVYRTWLRVIPGFGDAVAQAWLAEIGPAPHQHFASHDKLACWVTLCPGNNISARKRKHGRTGDAGTYIKPMLIQAAWAAIRVRGRLQARYNRLVRRFGGENNPGAKKKAITAHTLLKIAYQVLKTGTPYQEPGADFYTRRESPAARQAFLERQLQKLHPGCTITITISPPEAALTSGA